MDTLRNVVWTRCNSVNLGLVCQHFPEVFSKKCHWADASCRVTFLQEVLNITDFTLDRVEVLKSLIFFVATAPIGFLLRHQPTRSQKAAYHTWTCSAITWCCCILWCCCFFSLNTILESLHQADKVAENKRTQQQQQQWRGAATGVCSIPMTVQLREESAITRQQCVHSQPEEKKKELAFSKFCLLLPLRVFKPANQSRAFPQTLFSGYILTFIPIICTENLV